MCFKQFFFTGHNNLSEKILGKELNHLGDKNRSVHTLNQSHSWLQMNSPVAIEVYQRSVHFSNTNYQPLKR